MTFTLPAEWHPHIHPRRGGRYRPTITPDPDAPATFTARLTEYLPRWQQALAGAEPVLAAELADYTHDKPTPLGAAVAAYAVMWTYDFDDRHVLTYLVDAWVLEHGIVFAAEAAAELGRVRFEPVTGTPDWDIQFHAPDTEVYFLPAHDAIVKRARTLLALASDTDYVAATDALAGHRRDHRTRLLVSYLVPTRGDWVDELVTAAVKRGAIKGDWTMLVMSVGTRNQVDTLAGRKRLWQDMQYLNVLATLADGLGTDMAPALDVLLQKYPRDATVQAIAAALA